LALLSQLTASECSMAAQCRARETGMNGTKWEHTLPVSCHFLPIVLQSSAKVASPRKGLAQNIRRKPLYACVFC
jgi:hypothetical protein